MIETIDISSLEDERVDVFRDVRDRDLRGRQGMFMAESEMVVRRLLKTPEYLHSLLLTPAKYESLAADIDASGLAIPVYIASLQTMESIAGFHIHRGVLAAGWRPTEQDTSIERTYERVSQKESCTILAASGINNSDNMGGLFRTAAAFGVNEIILDSRCCDPLYRKAIRVSMGHVLSVQWSVADDFAGALNRLQSDFGFGITAAESGVGGNSVRTWSGSPRCVLVVGAEGEGLSGDVLDVADEVVEIPMSSEVPSLNVVVAAGVVLSHLDRI